ncbi:MAG: hypothetical protein PHS62_01135 [Patescibacteria group bacterium]|nr:hypothetical protein [Patescibacteria group bacterium]
MMTLSSIKNLDLKNKIIISLAGFLIALFCLIYFIIIPTIVDIKTMGQAIEEQRVDLEIKYIKGQSLKQLSDNLKVIQPQLNLLDQIFINKNRELEFITTLENEANQALVSQKVNLNPPQAMENQEFLKSDLQLYTKGLFNQQLKYLLNLESLSYYVNIKSLELTPADSPGAAGSYSQELTAPGNQAGSINMFIDADAYWKKE